MQVSRLGAVSHAELDAVLALPAVPQGTVRGRFQEREVLPIALFDTLPDAERFRAQKEARMMETIWAVFRRKRKYYIETRDPRGVVTERLSRALNNAGRGYPTRRRAQAVLDEWRLR